MSSRGTIAGMQRTNSYRPSGQIAKHVIDSTIEDLTITQPVIRCQSHESFITGRAVVLKDMSFYLVSSRQFAGRFYVVVKHEDGEWYCSSKDATVAAQCIARAREYRKRLGARAALVAA